MIDGRVDDAHLVSAEPFSAFVQQEPNEGEPATERTEVRFLLDPQNLYIAVICFDSEPDNIVVSQSRRDANLDDTDSIQILLDTFNDGQNAFVFGTNPFGIEYDGQVMAEGQTGQSGRGGFNANWDADWTVRAQTTERGWEAEFAIPLKTLRYNPGEERTWGVNAMRNIRRKNEQVFLSPVPRGYNLHRVSVAGKLEGLEPAGAARPEALPYVSGVGQRRQDAADRHGRSHRRRRPRRQVGRARRPDARSDRQHRLRPGGSRRAAGEPDAVSAVLPRKAPVLSRERAALSARTAAGHRPVLLAPDWPLRERRADRHRRRADG